MLTHHDKTTGYPWLKKNLKGNIKTYYQEIKKKTKLTVDFFGRRKKNIRQKIFEGHLLSQQKWTDI